MSANRQRFFPIVEHLSFVAYFGSLPKQWSHLIDGCGHLATSVLGNPSVRYTVIDRAEPGHRHTRTRLSARPRKGRLRLRDGWQSLSVDSLVAPRVSAFTAPRDARRYREYNIVEDSWSLEFDPAPVAEGEQVGPFMAMSFNLDRLPCIEAAQWTDVGRQFAALMAGTGALSSGLLDVGTMLEIAQGRSYSAMGSTRLLFGRRVSGQLWVRAGAERHCLAQGVFWGNLLGRRMVEQLGGKRFLEEYRATECGRDRDLCTRYEDGSALLLLARQFAGFQFPYHLLMPATIERAAWLHERLAEAGLLCGSKRSPLKRPWPR